MLKQDLEQAQAALDKLTGQPNADFAFRHRDDGSVVYSVSIRLLSGALRYGSGDTLADAYDAAMKSEPIRPSVREAA